MLISGYFWHGTIGKVRSNVHIVDADTLKPICGQRPKGEFEKVGDFESPLVECVICMRKRTEERQIQEWTKEEVEYAKAARRKEK